MAALTLVAYSTNAQTNSPDAGTNKPSMAPAKPKSKRYTGKITSVDADAKTITFTLANGTSQTLHITSKTRIRKDGEPATLADATAGERIYGAERKDDAGDWVAGSVNIGQPKPRPSTNAPPAAAQ